APRCCCSGSAATRRCSGCLPPRWCWPRSPCSSLAPASKSRTSLEPDRARHAGATNAAVAPRVLGQVLLVIVLGVIERGRVEDLGGDPAVAPLRQHPLVGIARGLGEPALLRRVDVDARAVLRADVVALPHTLRGIVSLPEHAQQIAVAD